MGGKKEIYRDVRFFHGAIQFSSCVITALQLYIAKHSIFLT